jgi:circadian clock protein KaiC
VSFRGGYHDITIRKGGLDVFPRLVASEHHVDFDDRELPSGNPSLDTLLCGGIPLGTSTLLLGSAGTGKSTISTLFAVAAAKRGERSMVYIFDENIGTFLSRAHKLGIDVEPYVKAGLITVQQVDPAELSSGEFASRVRHAVEGRDAVKKRAAVVVVDSLNGYLKAMPEEKYLTTQLHELLAYLGQQGVVTLMTVAQSGMLGSNMTSPVDTTYLADNVILFRYFEARGHVRRAVSVVKKRNGRHEKTIRELRITSKGVEIGEPLRDFQGVLTGVPTYMGSDEQLMDKAEDAY